MLFHRCRRLLFIACFQCLQNFLHLALGRDLTIRPSHVDPLDPLDFRHVPLHDFRNDHVAAGAVDFIVERYIRVVDELAFFRLFISVKT